MKISDLLTPEQQETVYLELREKFEQPPTQAEIDQAAAAAGAEAAKLRNSMGAMNNPTKGKI